MKLKDYLIEGTPDYFEEVANDILKDIYFTHPREIDIKELCDSYGISISEFSDVPHASFPSKKDRKGLIIISKNENKNNCERREILAEEFSHLYLHQINELSSNIHLKNKLENQAFKLASNILLPTDWLMDIEVYPYRNELTIIASTVAEEFEVSANYAYKRLKLLNKNYIFGKEAAPVFGNVFYDMPNLFMPKKRIFVMLDNKNTFPMN